MEDRSEVGSFRLGVWKLTEKRSGAVKEYAPYVKTKRRYKYFEM